MQKKCKGHGPCSPNELRRRADPLQGQFPPNRSTLAPLPHTVEHSVEHSRDKYDDFQCLSELPAPISRTFSSPTNAKGNMFPFAADQSRVGQ
jgi:hypothetical protein